MHCAQTAFPHAPLSALPAHLLARVGPLLCLFPEAQRSELRALQCAERVCAECCIDADGIRESLRFCDASGSTCLRLFLLPDSDYTVWERIRECLPCVSSDARQGTCERCIEYVRCLGRRLRGQGWVSSLLRIEAGDGGMPAICATHVSGIGREIARRISRAEGVRYGR